MKTTSLRRALFVAGVMAMAGGMAHADAIFYPDGTSVNLGENAVESGLASRVLAQSPSTAPGANMLASLGVRADQGQTFAYNPMIDDTSVAMNDTTVDTTALGAGPAVMPASTVTTTTVTAPASVYVFPNINFDPATVMAQPHPMMSRLRRMPMSTAAADTFDSPQRAGEMSTMTAGVPNLLTTNENVALAPAPTLVVPSSTMVVPSSTVIDTTALGAGPAVTVLPQPAVVPDTWSTTTMQGPSNQALPDPVHCGPSADCSNLPD
jgi:hypothetical protein